MGESNDNDIIIIINNNNANAPSSEINGLNLAGPAPALMNEQRNTGTAGDFRVILYREREKRNAWRD